MQLAQVVLCRWTRYARLLSRHKGTKGDEYSIFSEASTYNAGTQYEKMTLSHQIIFNRHTISTLSVNTEGPLQEMA